MGYLRHIIQIQKPVILKIQPCFLLWTRSETKPACQSCLLWALLPGVSRWNSWCDLFSVLLQARRRLCVFAQRRKHERIWRRFIWTLTQILPRVWDQVPCGMGQVLLWMWRSKNSSVNQTPNESAKSRVWWLLLLPARALPLIILC